MTNKKKTYGVYGIIEMVAVIPCGKAKLNVPFSGGSQTSYGVAPAVFTTEDPMKQIIIENSDMFKNGKIKLVWEVEGTGKYGSLKQKSSEGNSTTTQPNDDGNQSPEPIDQVGTGSLDNVDQETEAEMKVVEVSDIDVARDYMVEKFGYTQTALRYKSNLLKAAEEHGIKFVTSEGPLA